MDSSLLRKMLKARVYVEEPDRVTLTRWTAEFRGDNATHIIKFEAPGSAATDPRTDESIPEGGRWACTCEYFQRRHTCSHVMAVQDMRPVMVRFHQQSRTPNLVPLRDAG